MNNKKYIIVCKYCGSILFKTNDAVVGVLTIEIKCPNVNCRKILKIPEDTIITLERKKTKKVLHT